MTSYPVNWSPDAARIVVNRGRRLSINDTHGAQIRSLNVQAKGEAYWSPDGSQIAFTGGRYQDSQVRVINADGSNPRALTNAGWRIAGPWSPDGKTLLLRVISNCGYYYYYYSGCSFGALAALDLTSGGETSLGVAGVTAPLWGLDGDRVFILSRGAVLSFVPGSTGPEQIEGLPNRVDYFGLGRIR